MKAEIKPTPNGHGTTVSLNDMKIEHVLKYSLEVTPQNTVLHLSIDVSSLDVNIQKETTQSGGQKFF